MLNKIILLIAFIGAVACNVQAQFASANDSIFAPWRAGEKGGPTVSAPLIYAPTVTDVNGGLLLSWSDPEGIRPGQSAEYRVLLLHRRDTIFDARTAETTVQIVPGQVDLRRNQHYTMVVHAYVSDQKQSFAIPGNQSAYSFTYLPSVPAVANPHFYVAGNVVRADCDYEEPPVETVHRIQMRVRVGAGPWAVICDSIENFERIFSGTTTLNPVLVQVQLKRISTLANGTIVDNTGPWVSAVKLTTCSNPTNVQITAVNATAFTITCDNPAPPAGAAYKYKINYRLAGSGNAFSNALVDALPASVSGIDGNAEYEVQLVRLCGFAGQHLFIESGNPNSIPWPVCDALLNPRAKFTEDTFFRVSTDLNVRSGAFSIRYREVDSLVWTQINVPGLLNRLNNYVVNGINPAKTYEVEVRKTCNGTAGAWSPATEIVCKPYVNPYITDVSPGSFQVSANGAPIDTNCNENVRFRVGNNGSWLQSYDLQCGGTPVALIASPSGINTIYTVEINKYCLWTGTLPGGGTVKDTVVTAWQKVDYPLCTPAPLNPALVVNSPTSFTANWTHQNTNYPWLEKRYQLRYRETAESPWVTLAATTGTTVTVNNLLNCQNYQVEIRAVCYNPEAEQVLQGDWSPVSWPANACPAPETPVVTILTNTSFSVSWNGEGAQTCETNTSYEVRYKLTTGQSWTQVNTTATSITVNNAKGCASYDVEVRRKCTFQVAENGQTQVVYTDWVPLTEWPGGDVCVEPLDPLVSVNSATAFTLSWTAPPVNTCDSSNIQFKVRYRLAGNGAYTEVTTNATELTVNGNPCDEYEAAVQKLCSFNGLPAASPWVDFTWTGGGFCSAPIDPEVNLLSGNIVEVEWTAPAAGSCESAGAQYTVRYRLAGSQGAYSETTTSATSITISGLVICQEYEIAVQKICSFSGQTEYSDWTSADWPTVLPGNCPAPENPVINIPDYNSFTVSWTAAAAQSCETGTQHEVRYKLPGHPNWTQVTVAANTATITGVNACSTYLVEVRRVCTVQPGAQTVYGDWVSAGVWPGSTCPAPLNPQLSISTTDAFALSWTAPAANACDTGSPQYRVRYRVLNSGTAYTELITASTQLTVSGIDACNWYEVEVQKICSFNGQPANSEWVDFTWPYTPGECPEPIEPVGSFTSDTEINVHWGTPVTSICDAGTYDQVRYKPVSASSGWTVVAAQDTFANLFNLDACGAYNVEVRKQCIFGAAEEFSDWVPAEITPCSNLPELSCGDSTTIESCNGVLLTNPAQVFSVIQSGGFPVQVTSMQKNATGTSWSGTGIAALPFGEKHVKVSWSNLNIDTGFKVCNGKITGVSDVAPYLPDLTPGPLAFGGEICLPPPSTPGFDSNGIHNVTGLPWDERGFGQNGTYDRQPPYPGYQPGAPYDTTRIYDPNGFNAEGMHANGTLYNDQGCSINGLTANNEPCNPNIPPYSWMDPGADDPETEAGLLYVQQIQDSLQAMLTTILNELKAANQDSITGKRNVCGQIRTDLNTTFSGLNLDPVFVFGPANIYEKEGMHLNFTAPPVPLQVNMDRNAGIVTLETQHIELYHCDKKLYSFIYRDDVLLEFLTANGLTDLSDAILDLIKRLPEETIQGFINNPQTFLDWLKVQVSGKVNDEYYLEHGTYGAVEPAEIPRMDTRRYNEPAQTMGHAAGSGMSLNEDDPYAAAILAQAMEVTPEDIQFEFLQGFEYINGVHRAHYLEAIVKERWMALTEHDTLLMPIDITNRGSDGKRYSVYLDAIEITPAGATMSAYAIIELPGNGQKLVFASHDITFRPWGLDLLPLKIELGNDIHIRLSNSARLKILSGPDTYVAFDCEGFAGIGISADVELCRNIVLPYDPDTDQVIPEPKRVDGHIQFEASDLSNFIVSTSIDPFVIPGHEDIKFIVGELTLDMSETVSPEGTPPPGYETAFADSDGFKDEWKGFHASEVSVILPKKFSSGSQPLTVGIQNLVIDDTGVSASVFAANILSIQQGNADGWAFSVDTFQLTVIMNSFEEAHFSGLIHVPIFRNQANTTGQVQENDCFDYTAYIRTGGVFEFTARMPDTVNFVVDMWKTESVTLADCSLQMAYANDSFLVVATLGGEIKISGGLADNLNLNVPKITFQNVQVSNRAPYFSPGTWGFPGSVGADFGGFELTIDSISMMKTADGDPALKFRAAVNIGDPGQGLGAAGSFKLIGEMEIVNGRQRWKYKDFQVDAFYIDATLPSVAIKGYVYFFKNNPVYGKGFSGGLEAKFAMMESYVQVAGIFGKVNNFKYFNVEVAYCGNIQLFPALTVTGIAGGLSYHMTRPNQAFGLPICEEIQMPTVPGQSMTGIVYTPTDTIGIGFKITVAAEMATESAFNFNATYEMNFHAGGGVNRVWIYGNARVMSLPDKYALPETGTGKPNNGAPISAYISLEMNFNTNVLDGIVEMYADFGNGAFRGTGPNGRLGSVAIHFANSGSYIKMGKPWMRDGSADQRLGLQIAIPGLGDLASIKMYLQIGSNIDPMGPIPAEIASLTGASQVNTFNTGSWGGQVAMGNGFAFGAELNIGSREYQFLIFTAGFQANVGFDLALRNLGTGAVCASSNQPVGINGWYAEGQAYAGVFGQVGIRVKIFGAKRNFNILSIAAAAVLQAKLPNPFWAQGAVGGQYNILNGLIKGQCNFQFTIGELCTIVGQDDQYENIPLIESTNPVKDQTQVSVQTNPTVSFHFPVNELISAANLGVTGNVFFRLKVDYARLKWRGNIFPTSQRMSDDKKTLTLIPASFLPAFDTLTLEVKVHIDSSGHNVQEEIRNVTFVTGPGSATVLTANVKGSYPIDGQYNFYKKEIVSGTGYIDLHKGQPDLFNEADGYEFKMRFSTAAGECRITPAQYSYIDSKITFTIPSDSMGANKVYRMQLLKVPVAGGPWAPGTILPNPCSMPNGGGQGQQQAQQQTGAGDSDGPALVAPTIKVLYTSYFRVSQHNTFKQKMEALEPGLTYVQEGDGYYSFRNDFTGEPFDRFELTGTVGQPPLVDFQAQLNTTPWFNIGTMNNLYELFPLNYGSINMQCVSEYNFPPTDAVKVVFKTLGASLPLVTASHYNAGTLAPATTMQTILYDVPSIVQQQMYDLMAQSDWVYALTADIMFSGNTNSCTMCTTCTFWDLGIPEGPYALICPNTPEGIRYETPPANQPYPVMCTYKLPAMEQVSSIKAVNLRKTN
jgi:hypothetical protein